jgi:uncharacterized protein with NAD-binding domain and iron-sulfur cluster
MATPTKVAILGGGVASIVAAFELTRPELGGRYEVTVYQHGWRLGGKCASGRNKAQGQRIEEHGLHVWFGFYENAFRVMRDAYRELGRPPGQPLATWDEAFKPCDEIVLYESFKGRWRGRPFKPPRNTMLPGENDALPSFWEVVRTTLDYLLEHWTILRVTSAKLPDPGDPFPIRLPLGVRLPAVGLPCGIDRLATDTLARFLPRELTSPDQAVAGALRMVEQRAASGLLDESDPTQWGFLFDAVAVFKRWLWRYVAKPNLDDDRIRLFFTMFDAASTMLAGIVEDDLVKKGFDTVNDEELRDWLRRHGANKLTIEQSPFVRALYDMAFAYRDGDINKPDMAAGTALHDILRIFFTYRGAFAWKMQAGMGDTVFTPFYEVLKRREVCFKFFHWVSKLHLSADGKAIEKIDVVPQVTLKRERYEPLVDVDGLPSWPDRPKWEQIEEAATLRRRHTNLEWEPNPLNHRATTLTRGKQFDIAVLGISVAGLRDICQELIEDPHNKPFGEMIANSHTVMTQAFQLWMRKPARALGWPFERDSIMTGYVEPLDTYADMSHLIDREHWKRGERVESVAYFCGVIDDQPGDTQKSVNERVKRNAIEYLKHDAKRIWPTAGRRGFDWNLLAGGRNTGEARFDDQFWLGNYQPTERYVLTPEGSVKYRLRADQSGYDNLFLAGDWIKTGLDAGCVEAAAMSGMQAARAISGSPKTIVGEDQRWLGGPPSSRQPARPRLPEYVDYVGLGTAPSPVECEDAVLYGFVFPADRRALAGLCDAVFARPTRGQFRTLVPLGWIILTFGEVPRIKPTLFPWCEMGGACERQAAFWVPVIALHNGQASVGLFVPIMWVDNPLSLAGGREIYGYNKNWGEISIPTPGVGPPRLSVRAYGGDFGKGKQAGTHDLIDLAPSHATSFSRAADDPGWKDLDSFLSLAERELLHAPLESIDAPGLTLVASPPAHFPETRSLPMFFLKQFRAVSNGRLASQQQVTDGGTTIKQFRWTRLPGRFELSLHTLSSHPIANKLGLHQPQVTTRAFQIRTDFVLEDGRVLWEGAASD